MYKFKSSEPEDASKKRVSLKSMCVSDRSLYSYLLHFEVTYYVT
jgi:hypothetical protein